MEKEIIETYRFDPNDFTDGMKENGTTFREVVADFERDFHLRHSGDYAYNLYANRNTMRLLEKGNEAAEFLSYGLELTQGTTFRPEEDGEFNDAMDKHSKFVMVYGIDSAYMNELDEDGDPIFGGDTDIYPLTLLIDGTMPDGVLRLATPTIDDDDDEDPVPVLVDTPKYNFA